MKNAKKKKSAKNSRNSEFPNKTTLLKDLRAVLEMHQYSGRTWELSVIRDTIKFLRQK